MSYTLQELKHGAPLPLIMLFLPTGVVSNAPMTSCSKKIVQNSDRGSTRRGSAEIWMLLPMLIMLMQRVCRRWNAGLRDAMYSRSIVPFSAQFRYAIRA